MRLSSHTIKQRFRVQKTRIFLCVCLLLITSSTLSKPINLSSNRKTSTAVDYLLENFSLSGKIILNDSYGIRYIYADRGEPNDIILTKGKNLTMVSSSGKINCKFLDHEKVIKESKIKKNKPNMFFLATSFFLKKIDPHIDGMLCCTSKHSLLPGTKPQELFRANILSPTFLILDNDPPRKAKTYTMIYAEDQVLLAIWKFID